MFSVRHQKPCLPTMPERPQSRRLSTLQALQLGELDPDSYTAHRLNHATPEHLYLTSRRCFIGPIPEGWLNSHRKSWYRRHVNLGYSSRAATFTANHRVSTLRRVSGLDGVAEEQLLQSNRVELNGNEPQPTPIQSNKRYVIPDVDFQQDGDRDSVLSGAIPLDEPNLSDSEAPQQTTSAEQKDKNETVGLLVPSSNGVEDGGSDGNSRGRSVSPEVTRPSVGESCLDPGSPNTSGRTGNAASTSSLIHQNNSPAPAEGESSNFTSGTRKILAKIGRSTSKEGDHDDVPETHVEYSGAQKRRNRIRFDLSEENSPSALAMRARAAQFRLTSKFKDVFTKDFANGQIVKMERMLVRIDSTPDKLPVSYDENSSQGAVSITKEKWREYVVVCRRSSKVEDSMFVLQIYKTRVIPEIDELSSSKKAYLEIPLGGKFARLNLYSSLDKTLVIWVPEKKSTSIYLICARSASNAVEWYTFLRGILGWNRTLELQINVPDLDICLRIKNPFDSLEEEERAGEGDEEEQMKKTLERHEGVAKRLIARCLEMLEESAEWQEVLHDWAQGERIGLAWKRYDRLEWIHGANEKNMYGTIAMIQSHDLELRPKRHYPTTARTRKGKTLTEPPPVEGFLIRLTSQRGEHQRMGRMFFKRHYFATHDQYLVFNRPVNADPPPPPKMSSENPGSIPSARAIAEKIPLVHAINPYPVKDGVISWLQFGADEHAMDVKQHDMEAYSELTRRVHLLKECDGFIDLCNVAKVRNVRREPAAEAEVVEDDLEDFDDAQDSQDDEGEIITVDDRKTFELVLKNGLIIRLQAYDKETKKEWKKRLRALVKYWKYRQSQNINLYKEVRRENLEELQIDEEGEAVVGQFAKKWELGKTFASPELYHMCGISCCRTIHLSGTLYRKPRFHGVFTATQCILVPGALLLFEIALRSSTGRAIKHIHHDKLQRIELSDCYLYSGLLTEGDLLYQNRTFDSDSPGHHALPRIWVDDGWSSYDEDTMTTFVLWRPSGKSWFRERKEDGKRGKLRRVSQLGRKGNRMVFRARSRAERDHWVLAIAAEIERSAGGEDVRIEEKKP